MPLKPSKFRLEETIHLAGQTFRVAGIAQLELPDASLATRYLLAGDDGFTQILEERGEAFSVLRQFSPTAAPHPDGREISVMGVRYQLGRVDKLTVLGADGAPVGAAPSEGILLSGRFEGEAALILREFAPGGTAAQTFYTVKPLGAGELLDAAQYAGVARERMERLGREATAHAETGKAAGAFGMQIGLGVVAVIVATMLTFACTAEQKRASGETPVSARE
jgi:hypothetical protein